MVRAWIMHSHFRVRIRFDKGTILFEVEAGECRQDIAKLPGVLRDPRVRAFRAPAWRYPMLMAASRSLGLDIQDDVRRPGSRPGPFDPIELRPYQDAALEAWELAGRRGLLALPTGSGKTRTALAAMARVGLSALCLVPTRVLLDQWHRVISGFYRGTVGRLGDGDRTIAPVTVATFESAYRHMQSLGNRFRMLVVDEAHHFGGRVRDEALEMSIADIRLGLTATPPEEAEAADRLAVLIGPVVYELFIGDLAGSFLANFDMITISLDFTAGERRRYDEAMALFSPVFKRFRCISLSSDWRDFMRYAARTPQGRRALDARLRAQKLLAFPRAKAEALRALLKRHQGSRVLIFTADNETAYDVARTHLVMPMTCDIGRAERDDVLERFRTGRLRALVSSRVLNEGLDVPAADVAVIVGGTMGKREHVQRIGRILRPAEGKKALVYELVVRGTSETAQSRRRRKGLVSRKPAEARL